MSASSGSGSEADFLPVSERPEWADVAPRPLPHQAQPVVAIERDELMGDLMDYFWAAVAANECSERVLALTGEIIRDLNRSHYTVWAWRWRCLEALGGVAAHAAQEFALTAEIAALDAKNYQLWNYRRRLVLALGPAVHAERELEFAAACLQRDAKNYHVWAHRQAVLLAATEQLSGCSGSGGEQAAAAAAAAQAAVLWSAELAFTERLLRDDVRNNSAWSQRLFVLRAAPPAAVGTAQEAYGREVEFASNKAALAPHSEAAWEALRSLAALPGAPRHALAADTRFLALAQQVLGSAPACSPALALLADVFLEQAALLSEAAAAAAAAEAGGAALPPAPSDLLEKVKALFQARGVACPTPRFNRAPLDVAKLWSLVSQHGGYDEVCKRKLWANVGRQFGPPSSMTNLSFHIKSLYQRTLLAYEREQQGVYIDIPTSPRRPRKAKAKAPSDAAAAAAAAAAVETALGGAPGGGGAAVAAAAATGGVDGAEGAAAGEAAPKPKPQRRRRAAPKPAQQPEPGAAAEVVAATPQQVAATPQQVQRPPMPTRQTGRRHAAQGTKTAVPRPRSQRLRERAARSTAEGSDELLEQLAAEQLAALATAAFEMPTAGGLSGGSATAGQGWGQQPGGRLSAPVAAQLPQGQPGQVEQPPHVQLDAFRAALAVAAADRQNGAAGAGAGEAAAGDGAAPPAGGRSWAAEAAAGASVGLVRIDLPTSVMLMQQAAGVIRGLHEELQRSKTQVFELTSELAAARRAAEAAQEEARQARTAGQQAHAALQQLLLSGSPQPAQMVLLSPVVQMPSR
ncbi:farnesyltransferase geranylgeranyltransferase type-1 subunit alpha [Chlorella sorokiniana]|uniref:Protein farnesyltransferase/geranylgeranyltransferase type-1 subunit alpha n=1 Tax=Chlorella sorokiniana TaxID=3076 RepID=A0A2P6TFN1_CHLSO|nr:farnesyltransferase geranylgeranyltransferase type-1 subunit alpha [Chlorella sorokiniana]|eukprot:PRW32925.1 farnesyltransferase geranylgeranyltransferase type-1 subunit alpha [Chlorella sorokiniana]